MLLGRDWLQEIRPNWQSLGVACIQERPPTLQAILHEYDNVFSDELGTMKEFRAKLVVKPAARPRFHRPCSVLYPLKGATEKELDHLEETGVIEKVAHAEWAAPIVVVPKWDSTVRLCGEYKVTVNKELDIDQYALPRPEDLLTSLTGGQIFRRHIDHLKELQSNPTTVEVATPPITSTPD